jgi:hypothetical protein
MKGLPSGSATEIEDLGFERQVRAESESPLGAGAVAGSLPREHLVDLEEDLPIGSGRISHLSPC